MSLAEELLADLDDYDGADDIEVEEDIVDINDQLELAAKLDDRSVHALTTLNQSQLVSYYINM